MTAASLVDWSALGKVVGYALLAGIGLPAVYALAVLGVGRTGQARRAGDGATAWAFALLALVCAAVCVAAVVYGVYLMTQK